MMTTEPVKEKHKLTLNKEPTGYLNLLGGFRRGAAAFFANGY